jgi:hypothetical protein
MLYFSSFLAAIQTNNIEYILDYWLLTPLQTISWRLFLENGMSGERIYRALL